VRYSGRANLENWTTFVNRLPMVIGNEASWHSRTSTTGRHGGFKVVVAAYAETNRVQCHHSGLKRLAGTSNGQPSVGLSDRGVLYKLTNTDYPKKGHGCRNSEINKKVGPKHQWQKCAYEIEQNKPNIAPKTLITSFCPSCQPWGQSTSQPARLNRRRQRRQARWGAHQPNPAYPDSSSS